ncbi:MAG TPA: hypothetical protein VL442_06870 [Mucilaginibacter sp.]|nr:hypothetical protein [Mucilaginibacter sp.]
MKIIKISIAVLFFSFSFQACKKDASSSPNINTPTGSKQPPVVASTVAISSITSGSATSGGTITDDGGANITAKGICWSTSPGPTIANSKTNDGSGKETFNSALTNLESNTKYYVRSYATNLAGTAYGNEVSFTTLQPYRFSSALNVIPVYISSDYGYNSAYINPTSVYQRSSTNGQSMTFSKSGPSSIDFSFTFPNEPKGVSRTDIANWTGFFAVDNSSQYLYVVVHNNLYKCDLGSQTATLILANVGHVSQIHILPNNDLAFATDLSNGSIQKITANTSVAQVIASNLGGVPRFDFINGDYYFTVSTTTTGTVKKATPGGTVTTVIDNLNDPSRIVVDNYGNLVVETGTTIDGNNYRQYTIYKNTGAKLMDLTDDKGVVVLSGISPDGIPLFVDVNNNLFFAHGDQVVNGSTNHCNPFNTGAQGEASIYKIQLIKQ